MYINVFIIDIAQFLRVIVSNGTICIIVIRILADKYRSSKIYIWGQAV